MKIESSGIGKIIILIFGLAIGMIIVIESLLSNTSVLGQLYLFFAIGAYLLGLFSPKAAIYALIFCTGYIDFFKRLMVIAGQPTNFDVACSLATPPILCAGALTAWFTGSVMKKGKITKSQIYSLLISIGLLVVTVLSTSDEGARGLGKIANTAAYPFLLVLLPVYFGNIEDKIKLMKFTYVVFIGVALYMLKHAYFGLADFEYDYLLTNLSQEVRILTEGANKRMFSTMNGAAIVSIMCGLMFAWSFVNPWSQKVRFIIIRSACALLFVVASYYTLSRTGWFCGIATLLLYFTFKSWKSTILVYALSISLIGSLVVFSPTIKEMQLLEKLETSVRSITPTSKYSRADQAITFGSMNGRLQGWVNLMTKDNMWTPFGWRMDGRRLKDVHHEDMGDDIIFWAVMQFGYVTCTVAGIILLSFMYKLHRFVCSLAVGIERKVCTICLATAVGILFGGLSNSAQLLVFPVNIYFYLNIAFVYSLYIQSRESRASKNVEPVEILPNPTQRNISNVNG